jgi:AraC-like DNA-binding protein
MKLINTTNLICDFLGSADTNSLIWRYYINEFEPGWSMPSPHAHQALEVEFVLEGTGLLKFDSSQIKIAKNNCIIIFPNRKHWFYVPENHQCKMINIHFDLSETNMGKAQLFSRGCTEPIPDFISNIFHNSEDYMKISDHNDIEALMRKIVFEMETKLRNYDILVKMHFCELLLIISRIIFEKKKKADAAPIYVAESINYIAASLSAELSPEIIASAIHISADYLLHIFKEHTGFSLMEYVTARRVEKAKELLKSSSQSITSIAGQVGITNMQYFSTLFKRHIALTPTQYRRKSRSANNSDTNIFK